MIADVADSLQHAHDEGVIHRDIKPSNLLLSSDGRLSLNDFGLARVLEQPGMTMTGEFMGSALYMSPEQITAGRAPLDHRTDIYSLGATLYELLTLEPPFPGKQRDQIIGQILHKDPVPPRRKSRCVPIDLETICLRAMEKDPDRRYQTAGEMAEDLRRYVNRFAISARRIGVVGRVAKWVRRRPALAASGLLIMALATLLLSLGYWTWRRELDLAKERTIDSAMQGRFKDAEDHLDRVRRLRGSEGWVRMLEGQIALHKGDYAQANQSLREANRLMPESTAAYGAVQRRSMAQRQ